MLEFLFSKSNLTCALGKGRVIEKVKEGRRIQRQILQTRRGQ